MVGKLNEIELAALLVPQQIVDDAGIPLSVGHLEFLGVKAQSLADWRARRAPLGMSPAVYREFCQTLFDAAVQDRLTDMDARLKGSAAVLYSGIHKELPVNPADLFREYRNTTPLAPNEKTIIQGKIEEFRAGQPWPKRRPFDCLHRLGLHPNDPSDYDVQICSDVAVKQCMKAQQLLPDADDGVFGSIFHDKYGFVQNHIASKVIQQVMMWSSIWKKRLGRDVNVKLFGSRGPDNVTLKDKELSAHFRTSDWHLCRPGQGD